MPAQAGSMGVTVRLIEFTTAGELGATFVALARQPAEALVVMSDAALYDLREPISCWHSSTDSPPSHTSLSLQTPAP
jgi:hypothetical protein